MENIILIGFMGSGKSSVGKRLASELNMNFIDMDSEIEKQQGRNIQEIFAAEGEPYFRDLESGFLREFNREHQVIATGGGVVTRDENVSLLKKLGTVVFLHASLEHILNNVKGDTKRPLLQGQDVEERAKALLELRESHYLGSADLIIQTSGKTIEDIVKEIMSMIVLHEGVEK